MENFDITSLFWLLFLLSALQPMFQRRMLEAMRQRKIMQIEKKRNSRVILLVHRQETMSFLGFPVMRFIDMNDSEEILRAIQLTDPKVPLDLVLHTPGGMVIAATQIARAVKQHPGKVTVFVPHLAMSGGTLIALAADEICMTEHSALGPIDPQLGQQPAASILKVKKEKPVEKIDDNTLVMADLSEKAIRQIQATAEKLLEGTLEPDKAKELATMLSEGRWTHDHPIFAEDARAMGLNVNTDMPEDILKMMALYPQPTRQTPSVEYVPSPHPAPGKSRG